MRKKEASKGASFCGAVWWGARGFLAARGSDVGVGFAIRTRLLLCKSVLSALT